MAIYLIDYENVYIDGLTGMEELTPEDEVIIFYTQNRCTLTFDLYKQIIANPAKISLMEVEAVSNKKITVKNALDLQLSMYIGYLMGKYPDKQLYVITGDTDFELNVLFSNQYLENEDAKHLIKSRTIYHAIHGEDDALLYRDSSNREKLRIWLSSVLGPKEEENLDAICDIITEAQVLQDMHRMIAQYYKDGEHSKTVYHTLKPYFPRLKGHEADEELISEITGEKPENFENQITVSTEETEEA